MTKDEIMKAYEICASANDCSSCNDCPDCANCASAAALNLITEQEKEIERLKAEFKQLETNAEILARGVRDLNHENYELTEKIKQAQIDVLNDVKDVLANQKHECLERNNLVGYSAIAVCEKYIDELIEEVENDK